MPCRVGHADLLNRVSTRTDCRTESMEARQEPSADPHYVHFTYTRPMSTTSDHRAVLSEWFNYCQLDNAQLHTFDDQGYLVIGPMLTDAGLHRMRDDCMAAWQAEKDEFKVDGTWLENALLTNIHHHSDCVRQYYFSGPLVDVATQVIGPNIKAATTQLTFKMRGNTQSFGWHQDNAYGELDPYNAISCLTALDNADLENGCLWLVPGSHKEGQVEYEHSIEDKKEHRDIEMDVDESRAVPMPLKAGYSLFFHCHMLHKSEGNKSKERDRRILFMRYADADAVEVYNNRQPRVGRLVRGTTKFDAVRDYEYNMPLW